MLRAEDIMNRNMAMAVLAAGWVAAAGAAETNAPVTLESRGGAQPPGESILREAAAGADRAVAWLLAQQNEAGHWSNGQFPALTALPLWALARAGKADSPQGKRAVDYLLSCAHENGAIYREPKEKMKGGGMPNYNTAIAMAALHISGDPRATPVVLKARRFIARSQHLGGDVYYGGMGYDADSGRAYADLSNSYIAYEAMRATQSAEDVRKDGETKADLDWKAAQKFVQRTQNDARFNEATWASDDPADRGGFAYHPGQSRAGTTTNRAGVVKFRSMKGMTYAGLLSYIYAEVDRTDPRVEATVNWAVNHWGLAPRDAASGGAPSRDTEMEKEGLYYLLNVMSKGLAAYGQDVLRPAAGEPFNWRVHMIETLVGLQKTDAKTGQGFWINEVGRYWESDPVLVTSYALISLQVAMGR